MLRRLLGLLRGELHVDRIKAKEAEVQKLKAGKHTVDIENTYIHISGTTPYIRFEGTEAGAADKGIKEDAGSLKIYDFSAASDVMDLETHASRHLSGGADEVLNLTNINNAIGFSVDAHASRHAYGGADALTDNALRFSQIDKVFGTESTVTVTAGSTSTISKGVYLVSLGANTKVEYSPDNGTTWRLLIPAGEGGVVISDGSNVRLNNTGASDEDSYLLPVQ
ncbi:MAG: hypothetical protein DRN00_02395 [Thermoplasmata archaeon]|nr:MAG: hypothetical protein DRN00_02395 [Thermoplasmata archaeon]